MSSPDEDQRRETLIDTLASWSLDGLLPTEADRSTPSMIERG